MNKASAFLAFGALIAAPTPAHADNAKTPPGNPCAKGNGNPCNGNNGNGGRQGNAQRKRVVIVPAPPMSISRPAIADRGVFITQVGEANRATVTQTPATAYALVDQNGDRNVAAINQRGSALAYADLRQSGTRNDAVIAQDGAASGNAVFVAQSGANNIVRSSQVATGGAENAAVMAQAGTANIMTLDQHGSDNLARLTQNGSANAMTAAQTGSGNRLIWTQTGDGLSNLAITQSSGQSAMITQSR